MFPFIPLYTILDAQTKSDGFHFFLLENSSFHNSYNWWVEILFANFMSLSEVAQSCPTLCDPWTVAHQAPPSMGFSRQEYWSGLPFPSPGDLPDPGIEPRSPTLQADTLTSEPPGKPTTNFKWTYIVKKYKRRKKIYKINLKQLRKWQ